MIENLFLLIICLVVWTIIVVFLLPLIVVLYLDGEFMLMTLIALVCLYLAKD